MSSSSPRALMEQALARHGFVDSPDGDDSPTIKLCELAGLTPYEYEAVVMTAQGLSARRVGTMCWPRRSQESVYAAAHRGIAKLTKLLNAEGDR